MKEQALASIDKQIEGWEKYKEQWSNVVNQYQEQQDKLLAEQLLGIDTEQENWNKRIGNLTKFVNQYNSILSQLGSVSNNASASVSTPSGGDGYYFDYSKKPSSSSGSQKNSALSKAVGIATGGALASAIIGSKILKHAQGSVSAPGGLSLVGENGPELRVLNSGDGVIPADVTRNLWDWASFSPKDILSRIGSDNIFHIGNIALPNVKDAQSFVVGLKQLAYQRAYKRA